MEATAHVAVDRPRNRFVLAYEAGGGRGPAALADCLPPRSDPGYLKVLTELVRADLEHELAVGHAVRLTDYLAEYPELADDPHLARTLAADEVRLRRRYAPATVLRPVRSAAQFAPLTQTPPPAGSVELTRPAFVEPVGPPSEPTTPADIAPTGAVRFPAVGDEFLGFRLIGELGRGAFARVFLAEQVGLSDRPVALKVTARPTKEPQRLARLRHTNIVPIYSVHDCPPIQAVCMPFLGRQILSDLIKQYRETGSVSVSAGTTLVGGRSATVVTAGDSVVLTPVGPNPGPAPQPVLEMLSRLGHTDLVLWIIGRLADGLAHAHDRGILHLDLKPANVLFADDGQPLLLDFNLSFDTTAGDRERAGGTLPYMAPEQLEEYRDGGPTRVDKRSDLYALGVIFFELLTGRHPFPTGQRPSIAELIQIRRAGPPSARRFCPGLSPAVAAIIQRLLQPDPEKRYQSAWELLTDLDRHAHCLPLRHAPNTSVVERVRKWRRRHPRAGLKAVLAAAMLAAAGFGVAAREQAEARTRIETTAQARAVHDELLRLRVDLATRDDAAMRQAGLSRGRELLARYGLPEQGRDWVNGPDVRPLPEDVRAALADDLGELCLLMAHAEWLGGRGKGPEEQAAATERARAWNRAAESGYADRPLPSAVEDQKRFLSGAGEYGPANPAPTGVDLYLRAAERMASGRYADAAELLETLTDRDPGHAAAQLCLGVCRMERGEKERAMERFQVARGLSPKDPRPAYNRGLLLMRRGRLDEAEKEFTDAIAKDPNHAQAYKHRALVRQGKYPRGAVEDLTRAIECGLPPIQGHLLRARVYDLLGEKAKAAADRAAAAGLTPHSPEDHIARGLGRLEQKPKPDVAGALADFAAAAELNPHYLPAWQNQAAVLADWLAQPVKALDLQQKAVAVAPDFAPARVGLAVLLARLGHRDEAHAEAQKALVLSADPEVIYQAACVYSLTSKTHPADRGTALDLFRKSLREGFRKFRDIDADPDLKPIRQTAEFQAALKAAKELVR